MRRPLQILAIGLLALAAPAFALTFSEWQASYFTPAELADPAISGPEADPDGDGQKNLIEYAFDRDPFGIDAVNTDLEFTANGLRLIHPEYVAATDLLYHLTESRDLIHWLTPNAATRAVLSENATLRLVALSPPNLPAQPDRWFARLRVHLHAGGAEPLFAPSALSGVLEAPFALSLGWNDNARVETGYTLEKNTGSGFFPLAELPADRHHYRDEALLGSTTYRYRVTARQGSQLSAPSAEFSITTPLDSDGDGLSDELELTRFFTNPNNPDSDNDGLPDGWEVRHGLNPKATGDQHGDLDQDGLTNGTEYKLGLDPTKSDSDRNGTPDAEEDGDGDGLPNQWEQDNGTDPTQDDADEDPDQDGLSNAEELEAGTLPFNAYTDGDTVIDGEDSMATDADFRHRRQPEPRYMAISLGGFQGFDVSAEGIVLSWDRYWRNGQIHSLPNDFLAYDINDGGRIAGEKKSTVTGEDGEPETHWLLATMETPSAPPVLFADAASKVKIGNSLRAPILANNGNLLTSHPDAGRFLYSSASGAETRLRVGEEDAEIIYLSDDGRSILALTNNYPPEQEGFYFAGNKLDFAAVDVAAVLQVDGPPADYLVGTEALYGSSVRIKIGNEPSKPLLAVEGGIFTPVSITADDTINVTTSGRILFPTQLWQNGRLYPLADFVPSDITHPQGHWMTENGLILLTGYPIGSAVENQWLLLPVEMKVVDRDDPKKKWGSEKDHNAGKPIYAGESCGDMVSWKLGGTDTWSSTVFTWTAEGPGGETITGPTGAGKNEWKIADGDDDTANDWLKWKPGTWKIKVQIGSAQAEFEQEVGIRTEQYFAFGMIPTEAENTSGVSADTINDWACPNILYSMWAAVGGGINSPQSSVYVPMNESNRVYVNHRLLNSTRNLDHDADLRPDKGLAEACGLDPYKHYRFFAGCQLRFRVDQNTLAATPEFVAGAKEDMVGFTPAPCSQSNFAGVIGEKHGDSGKLTGASGDAEFSFVTKNRVGRTGQTGWANLNGRQIPWVFFRFRFEAKDGLIDTKFSEGASDNPNGPDAKDYSRVPTIYVYRRYYDLSASKWKVELICKIDENRRPFFSNGTPISGAPYVLP
jgi:hypothetical protein